MLKSDDSNGHLTQRYAFVHNLLDIYEIKIYLKKKFEWKIRISHSIYTS
jgi:hypothetical protein